jgi:hypothetical protein
MACTQDAKPLELWVDVDHPEPAKPASVTRAALDMVRCCWWSAVLALVSCGPRAQGPSIEYQGDRLPRTAQSVGLVRLSALPDGARVLGRVTASCVTVAPGIGFKHLPLGTLDCSTTLLGRALDDLARSVGARALIGQTCNGQNQTTQGSEQTVRIDCEAMVATLPESIEVAPSFSTEPSRDFQPLPIAFELSTSVDFEPYALARGHRSPDLVSEVPRQPAADVVLGTMRVVVAAPATRDHAQSAVRIAALRVGARHFESAHCVRRHKFIGWDCTTRLYCPEVDERVVPAAR